MPDQIESMPIGDAVSLGCESVCRAQALKERLGGERNPV
jgi:hypothetical protein